MMEEKAPYAGDLAESGSLQLVGPGPRERLLELKNKLEAERTERRRVNAAAKLIQTRDKVRGRYNGMLRRFAKDYFGKDVFDTLPAGDHLALAEICSEHCRRYIAKSVLTLAALSGGTYYLTSFSGWWHFGWIACIIGSMFVFMMLKPKPDLNEFPGELDYRFRFSSVRRRLKKFGYLDEK